MSGVIEKGYGSPAVYICDAAGNLVLNTQTLKVGTDLITFRYTFDEGGDGDSGLIVIQTNDITLVDFYLFYVEKSLYVSWGYITNMRELIKVWVLNLHITYSEQAIVITLSLTNNLNLFRKNNYNPTLFEANKFKLYLDTVKKYSDLEIHMEDQGKKYFFDGINWYLMPIAGFNEGKPFGVEMSDLESGRLSFARVFESGALMPDPLVQVESASSGVGALYPTDPPKEASIGVSGTGQLLTDTGVGVNGQPLYNQQNLITIGEDLAEWLGVSPDGSAFGTDMVEGINNLIKTSAKGPFHITGSNGKIIIHNSKIYANAIWQYGYAQEFGDLLSFDYDTNSRYTGKSVLSNFGIDPVTGALNLKTFIDKREEDKDKYDNASPDQANESLQHSRAYESWIEQYETDPTAMPKEYQSANNNMAPAYWDASGDPNSVESGIPSMGNLVAAKDETSREMKHLFLPNVWAEEMSQDIDKVIAGVKKGSNEKGALKYKAKMIGNPEMMAGQSINFFGLGERNNGKYYCTHVEHSIDGGSGYITSVEMRFSAKMEAPVLVSGALTLKAIQKNIQNGGTVSGTKKEATGNADDHSVLGHPGLQEANYPAWLLDPDMNEYHAAITVAYQDKDGVYKGQSKEVVMLTGKDLKAIARGVKLPIEIGGKKGVIENVFMMEQNINVYAPVPAQ